MPVLVEPIALATWREAKGLSAAQLAERARVGRQSIYDWEARRRMMGADDVVAVADALELGPLERAALLAWAAERA